MGNVQFWNATARAMRGQKKMDDKNHKCRVRKGQQCTAYCAVDRDGTRHNTKWKDVDCEDCIAVGLRLGHCQPNNRKGKEAA